LDLAKHVFQIHGIDAAEKVVVRKQLRRSQVMAFFEALSSCLIGMEVLATLEDQQGHLGEPPGEKIYNDQKDDCGDENMDVSPHIRTERCHRLPREFQRHRLR
jgi:hypothetical protein